MAAGDFTVVTTSYLGDSVRFTGTCEAANGTEIDFNVTSVLNFVCINADDEESARAVLNSDDGTADTAAGSVYIVSAAALSSPSSSNGSGTTPNFFTPKQK